MTDLLTRIRAYVAATPTHECAECDYQCNAEFLKRCPHCDAPSSFGPRKDTPADALLREVAALEPKAYLVHGGRIYVDAVYIGEDYARSRIAQREDNAILTPLYTLTGAGNHE